MVNDSNFEKEKSAYQAFIENKHKEKFNTSIATINEIIERSVGSSILKLEKIIKGEANEVYSVTISEGKEIILRIGHGSRFYFEREKWAIETCVQKGIPAPKVLHVGEILDGEKKLTYCAEEKLAGIPLDEIVAGISEDDRADKLDSILQEAGKLLSEINSIEVKGWGDLDKEGVGKYSRGADVLQGDYVSKETILAIAEKISFDIRIIEEAFDLMAEDAKKLDGLIPRLLHNDFGPKHLLVSDNKITGVIDFENAEAGDPVKELARWDFFYKGKYSLETLLKGYGRKDLIEKDFASRFRLWSIFTAISNLHYYVGEGNQSGIDLVKRRLTELVG